MNGTGNEQRLVDNSHFLDSRGSYHSSADDGVSNFSSADIFRSNNRPVLVGFRRSTYGYPIGIEAGQGAENRGQRVMNSVKHWLRRRKFSITTYWIGFGGCTVIGLAFLQAMGVL